MLECGICCDYNPWVERPLGEARVALTWSTEPDDVGLRAGRILGTLDEYRQLVKRRQFVALLFDASLLQFKCVYRRSELIYHRFCYYPCPITVDRELLQDMPILDVWEGLLPSDFLEQVRLLAPIRFDFDVDAANDVHPASHMTVINPDCRIPVVSPLGWKQFLRFVFSSFYPDTWRDQDWLRELSSEGLAGTITDEEALDLHLSYRRCS